MDEMPISNDIKVKKPMCFVLGFTPNTEESRTQKAVERAVAAERERCAKIAETTVGDIAAEIRGQ